MQWPVLLFYRYVEIPDPASLVGEQKGLCADLGLKGRILIAREGINGTVAGTEHATGEYRRRLAANPLFSGIEFKISEGAPDTFPKMVVKHRPEIVTLGVGELKPDLHNHLSPEEWKRRIEEDPDVVVVDVRNRYESAAGKFEGALECEIENFRDLPEYVDKLNAVKDKTILMYCTGGIRCEKASALFRRKGFRDVFQLHGGIMNYQKEFGNEHWLGECFVFDKRMTVKVPDGLVHISRCEHTGRRSARYVNCLNDDCHRLFILSEEAEAEDPDLRYCPDCLAGTRKKG